MGSDTWNDAPSSKPPSLYPLLDCFADTLAVNDGAGWKPDNSAGDAWQADGDAGGDNWTGEISEQNISKHADGFDALADGGCRK